MIWEIIGGILLSLLASELYASCPWLTTTLLKRAKRTLPEEYQDRYWEEWLGELDAQRDFGNLKKLGWAFGVLLSSGRTAETLYKAIEQGERASSGQNHANEPEDWRPELEEYMSKMDDAAGTDDGSVSGSLKFFLRSIKIMFSQRPSVYVALFKFLSSCFKEALDYLLVDKQARRSRLR
jgi:hypothetical protein